MEPKEKYTITLIKDLKVVFDIGAREDAIEFIEMYPDAEYHLFEPNKHFADSLKSNVPVKANAVVNQYGMWNENVDKATYYANVQSFIPHPFLHTEDSGHVFDLRTIDWYVKENKIDRIDYLKIDAEGCDYKILQGAKDTIGSDKIRYIQFEYWDGVRKFSELLQEKYDMFFIRDTGNMSFLNEDVIKEIDEHRIPSDAGGDVFCAHKKESFSL